MCVRVQRNQEKERMEKRRKRGDMEFVDENSRSVRFVLNGHWTQKTNTNK